MNPAGDASTYLLPDPRHAGARRRLEASSRNYLKRIGALPASESFQQVRRIWEGFPVEAPLSFPWRNRQQTIAEAVNSALSQKTDFFFNVSVVDNHSTDRITPILSTSPAAPRPEAHYPKRTDLGIGGAGTKALGARSCGRYAVQLDSDDLYSSTHTLQKMVDKTPAGRPCPGDRLLYPGRFQPEGDSAGAHRPPRWTDENGRTMPCASSGLGLRVLSTPAYRKIGFLNVSYGEDLRRRGCASAGNTGAKDL